MASNPPPPNPGATLPCEQCGYARNEPERVYCHNCGAKLDRSLLPKAAEKKQENPAEARKRIAKMTNPKSGVVGREIKAFFKVLFFSALLAVAILFFWPTGRFAGTEERPGDAPLVEQRHDGGVMQSPTPRPVSFSDGRHQSIPE